VARTQIYPGAGEHVSYAVEDIIYKYHAEWPTLRWQDFRAKNDHPEGEVVVVGPHIEQGIPFSYTVGHSTVLLHKPLRTNGHS
jgi:hypothetical protein